MILKKRVLLNLIICFFSILLLNSCYLIPCNLDSELNKLNQKHNDSFFIGEYTVESFINNNNNLKTDDISIKVNKNKTLEIDNIPKYILNLTESEEKITISGKWKTNYLEKRKEHNYFFVASFKYDNSMRGWKMYEKNDKPVILIEVGDPDECSAIRFIKK